MLLRATTERRLSPPSFASFFVLALLALQSMPLVASASTPFKKGDVPDGMLGRDSTGKEIRLSDLRGKVVVVSFWASWCPPCLAELPVLDNLQRHVGNERLSVVAINFKEPSKHFNLLRTRLEKKSLALTLTHDRAGTISKRFGVKVLPHLFLLDHTGRIAHIHLGYTEKMLDAFVDEINALLAAQEALPAAEADSTSTGS